MNYKLLVSRPKFSSALLKTFSSSSTYQQHQVTWPSAANESTAKGDTTAYFQSRMNHSSDERAELHSISSPLSLSIEDLACTRHQMYQTPACTRPHLYQTPTVPHPNCTRPRLYLHSGTPVKDHYKSMRDHHDESMRDHLDESMTDQLSFNLHKATWVRNHYAFLGTIETRSIFTFTCSLTTGLLGHRR